jgi:drug/metabolite transporter (DMT)-like permease
MPPPSPYPQAAEWFGWLQIALTFGAPLLLVAWLATRRPAWTPRRVAVLVAAAVAVMALIDTAGWYLDPDYAGSPRAAVAAGLVTTAPVLAAAAAAWLRGQRRPWSRAARVVVPMFVGYAMLVLCLFPALIVFVSLGGDTL